MIAAPAARHARTVAVIGNPNTGKTTLFNALTGLSQKVGNYPGVTVERKRGRLTLPGGSVELVDLPGTYSLAARSLDEMIAVDVLLGRRAGEPAVDAVVAVVDAANLERNLFLISQLLEIRLPLVIALNMMDGAARRGMKIDHRELALRLGVPVVPLRADRGEGLDLLRETVDRILASPGAPPLPRIVYPEALEGALDRLTESGLVRTELLRALVDAGGPAEQRLVKSLGDTGAAAVADARASAAAAGPLVGIESASRYAWAREMLAGTIVHPDVRRRTATEKIDAVLTHRVVGVVVLMLALTFVFQALYVGAAPFVAGIDWLFGRLSGIVTATIPDGPLQSLLVNGVIAGAGSVVQFLPQILLLFFLLSILEDCGYMARIAFLADRVFAWTGISGRAVIPLLSCFACAVPGVMAARTIENRRDRLATILVAPLMSCSARLPVYVLLIGAFVPNKTLLGGWLGLQGLSLLAAHLIGIAVAIPILILTRRTILRGPAAPFVLELPDYRWPSWLSIVDRLQIRARLFLVRAGTVIAAVGIVIWGLSYFPRPESPGVSAASHLEQSYLGRMGHAIEPFVAPLGWDWRIGVSVLASFPAREVVIATTGTILGVGSDVDSSSDALKDALHTTRRPDGTALFTLPVAVSLIVFFALCCQCGATLAVIRRETGSWGWPVLTFVYMTGLAYVSAFGAFRFMTWVTS